MNDKRPKKPFSLAKSKEPVVRDKDNAAPRIKPPEQVHLPHPRLAPPGMSGIKVSLSVPQQPSAVRAPEPERQRSPTKTFKPLVQQPPGKDRDR